jgi:hypothetical protein
MGSILSYNSYQNKSVDIPTGSPLMHHREQKTLEENNIYFNTSNNGSNNCSNNGSKSKYEILIKTMQNRELKKNPIVESMCCKERDYYKPDGYGATEYNRIHL